MGRTEFLTETDCERALVGRAKAKASSRAKWRSSPSACRRVLEKCLTPPTLLENGDIPPTILHRQPKHTHLMVRASSIQDLAQMRTDFSRNVVRLRHSTVFARRDSLGSR